MLGYARVSTEDQELRMQVDALNAAGCWDIWTEKRSATKGKRPALEELFDNLRPGDTVVVWKLDRLVRNAAQLYVLLDRIHKEGANFKSLQENFDFTTPMGKFVLGILALVAELEAQMTAHRTKAGIAAIKARGGSYGAKRKLTRSQHKRVQDMDKAGVSKAEIGRTFGISPVSVTNYINRPLPKLGKPKR